MASFDYINFGNFTFLLDEYERYIADPKSVAPAWRHFFEGMNLGQEVVDESSSSDFKLQNLITAYRRFGHLAANINPLQEPKEEILKLKIESVGFHQQDLTTLFPTMGLMEKKSATLEEIVGRLKEIYCSTIGVEAENNIDIQRSVEQGVLKPQLTLEEKKKIFKMLNKASLFEIFLHTKYVGQKRFSLEGGETLIPMLQEIIETGGRLGLDECVIGMSHRGRLNVLANILQKSYSKVFSEFEDYYSEDIKTGTGDVKYHLGFSANIVTESGVKMHLNLLANPSHLEAVDPVLEGKVYAKQVYKEDLTKKRTLPILIHGDAAFAGQGVVYETMQCAKLDNYSTGGTIHIVTNNHIGFTTLPKDARSTPYPTDIAKTFGVPVFHVNVEDPEACIAVAKFAIEIRQKFSTDVVIDLSCYRKYGHNEGDEPAFTQPLQYDIIRKKKPVREIYLDKLMAEGSLEKEAAVKIEEEFQKTLHTALEEFKVKKLILADEAFEGVWEKYKEGTTLDLFQPFESGVKKETLKSLAKQFSSIPEGFNVHPKIAKLYKDREGTCQKEESVDWALAECLSFASLLHEGTPIRFGGQDSRRGTFSQRHAAWIDQKNGSAYYPLKQFGGFEICDSPLSEYAALGFEFGYSLAYPSSLVIWEAQYGDFANGGQIIADQFLSSSEEKWQRYSGLTLLLPHAYEGQGPEHSSGRIERFLQLSAKRNMQIVYPTTPAQYFHLLRRQVLRLVRKPLVVFTPKGLLRSPLCLSPFEELSRGHFQEILDENNPKNPDRLLFCSGKIYYNLLEARKEKNVAIIRIEQLYPFHADLFTSILEKYRGVKEVFWVQEEPKNMGAWYYILPIFLDLLPKECVFQYIGRERRAAAAAGSHAIHVHEEKTILRKAFE